MKNFIYIASGVYMMVSILLHAWGRTDDAEVAQAAPPRGDVGAECYSPDSPAVFGEGPVGLIACMSRDALISN